MEFFLSTNEEMTEEMTFRKAIWHDQETQIEKAAEIWNPHSFKFKYKFVFKNEFPINDQHLQSCYRIPRAHHPIPDL